jgi:hypothetical protein
MNSGDAEAAAASKKARCKKEKKKKRKDDCGAAEASAADEEIVHDKKRKKQLQQKKNGDDVAVPNRKTTVSIAVAGSIIDNAQSLELATLVSIHPFSPSLASSCGSSSYPVSAGRTNRPRGDRLPHRRGCGLRQQFLSGEQRR